MAAVYATIGWTIQTIRLVPQAIPSAPRTLKRSSIERIGPELGSCCHAAQPVHFLRGRQRPTVSNLLGYGGNWEITSLKQLPYSILLRASVKSGSASTVSGAVLAGSASKRVLEMQRCRQHPGAYEFCARASVHRALEGFQTIDLPFGLAVAPTFGQRVPDRVNILPQRSNEALHRVEAGSMGVFKPCVEFHVAFALK